MQSFFKDSEKRNISEQLLGLHETFGRDIIVYKEARKVIMSSDPSYNYLYGNSGDQNTSVQYTPVRKVFKVRIKYDNNRDLEYMGEANSQLKVSRTGDSLVRIKLKIEDYDYIKEAKRIELDGRLFHINSDPKFHGLFDKIQFCTLYLKPIEAVAQGS
jgi:hypothetical protein